MIGKLIEENKVEITGEVVSEFQYSHEFLGEKFYMIKLSVQRLSGEFDTVPVMISGRMVNDRNEYKGRFLKVYGQYRSYNKREEKRNRLLLYVFAREAEFVGENPRRENMVFLDGHICKEPIYRKTPLGREITDLLIAVNRSYGKSDYIPCICWGRNARYASGFEIGGHVQVYGRIQSREYVKKLSETEVEHRVAYEVSISSIEVIGYE